MSVGEVVYYNPETNTKCNSSKLNQEILAKTGCLKWNVVTTNDEKDKVFINMMLDHNTTKSVAWNSSGNNLDGMNEVLKSLENDTANWNLKIRFTSHLISA